jgi:hypothetical protein
MNRLIFLLFLLLISCADKNKNIEKLPSWYLNPPKSKSAFYASGSGATKKDAVLNALSSFIATKGVEVASEIDIKKSDFGGGIYSSELNYKLKSKTYKIKISNYEIEKVDVVKNRVLVLVKIDKERLFESLKREFETQFGFQKEKFKLITEENPFFQYLKLKKFIKNLESDFVYLNFLHSINPDFNRQKYVKWINAVKLYYLKLKNSIKIEVVSDNMEVKKDIEKYLTDNGIKISKSDLVLKITVFKKNSDKIIKLSVYKVYMDLMYKKTKIGSNYFKIVLPQNSSLLGNLYEEIKTLPIEDFVKRENYEGGN